MINHFRLAPWHYATAVFAALQAVAQEPQAPQPIEEIHVIGHRLSADPDELAQAVSVLAGENLDRAAAATVGETLALQLGVSASSFGAGASRPIIRGLAGARVRTLEDGVDSMDLAALSSDHAVPIDPVVAEQIEIFRGPTTLLYGSGAIGGIVNTVTNRIPIAAPETGLAGKVDLRWGANAGEQALALVLDGGGERAAWHVDGAARSAGEYRTGGDVATRLFNTDTESEVIAAGGSWLGDRGTVGVGISHFGSRYGLPALPGEDAERVRIDLVRDRADIRGSWAGVSSALETVNLSAAVTDYEHVELENSVAGTRFTNRAADARVELMHRPLGAWRGAVGAQLGRRRFAAIGEEAFVPPVDSHLESIFIVEQRRLAGWQVSLGARLESLSHAPASTQPAFSATARSASVAALRDFAGGLSIAINAARTERLPAAEELYTFGPHLSTQTFEIGNVALQTEVARHVDFSFRSAAERISWDITVFRTEFEHFIYLDALGTLDDESGLPVFAQQQRPAVFHGVEAELLVQWLNVGGGEIDLRLYADRVAGDLDGYSPVPRIPPARVGVRLQYHQPRLVAGIEWVNVAGQDRIADYETRTGGYRLLQADLSWQLRAGADRSWSLFVRGTNLLDALALRHSSYLKEVAPLPGRNVSFGVRAAF